MTSARVQVSTHAREASSPRAAAHLLSIVLVGALGCVDGGVAETSQDEAGDTTGEDEDEGGEVELVAARGIDVTRVTVNQGVEVAIGLGAEWVGAQERNTNLLTGRDALLRVEWSLAEDWQPRDIVARLTLTGSGDEQVLELTRFVDGPPTLSELGGAFDFVLSTDAGQVASDLSYRVELLEPEDDAITLDVGVTTTPSAGPGVIGFEPPLAELKVVFVPMWYADNEPPVIDDVLAERTLGLMYEMLPVQRIFWDVHPPVEIDTATSQAMLDTLSDLKTQETLAANFYYAGLASAGNGPIDGETAFAFQAGPELSSSAWRVGITLDFDFDVNQGRTKSMIRNLLFNMGLSDSPSPCEGLAGTAPGYPYLDSLLPTWGYGVIDAELRAPIEHSDLLSRCAPRWTSDYAWSRAYARIVLLSDWDHDDIPDPTPSGWAPELKLFEPHTGR